VGVGRPTYGGATLALRFQEAGQMADHCAAIPGDTLTTGWGVLRILPWHLAGVFESSIDAENLVRRLGPGYVIKFGDHVPGSRNFNFQHGAA